MRGNGPDHGIDNCTNTINNNDSNNINHPKVDYVIKWQLRYIVHFPTKQKVNY